MAEVAQKPEPLVRPVGPGRGTELRDYLRILDRRKWIALVTFGLVLAGGIAWTYFQTPIYEATISVLIKEPKPGRGALEQAAALGRVETTFNIATEIRIIGSPDMRAKAQSYLEDENAAALIESVDVRVPRGTSIAEIHATSPDPEAARDFVVALAQAYTDYTLKKNQKEAARAESFVADRLEATRRDLREAEDKLEEFKRAHGIGSGTEAVTQVASAIEKLRAERRQAAADVAAFAAQQQALAEKLEDEPPETVTETSEANPALTQLESDLIGLETKRIELLAKYAPTSRRVVEIERQIEALKERIAEEVDKKVTAEVRETNPVHEDLKRQLATVASSARAAGARLQAIDSALVREEQRLAQMPTLEVEFARLKRDVDVREETYRTLLSTLEDLKIAKESELPSADIITEEVPMPQQPIRPQPRRNLLVSIGLGVLLALLSALLAEYLDDKFRTLESLEEETSLPLLGGLPQVESEETAVIPLAATGNRSTISQAADSIWANVQFCGVDGKLHTILVSSPGVGEGKTTLAANLAIAAANSGNSVILVDSDLRRPTLHQALGTKSTPGLTNVVAGGMALQDVLQLTSIKNLKLLAAGPVPPNAVELLSSESMQKLVAELKSAADVVIFDTPPLLLVPDAQILSQLMDGTVLLARLGRTSRAAMARAIEMLDRAGGRLLGAAANWVTRKAQYYYYYYYYYSDYYYGREAEAEPTPTEQAN